MDPTTGPSMAKAAGEIKRAERALAVQLSNSRRRLPARAHSANDFIQAAAGMQSAPIPPQALRHQLLSVAVHVPWLMSYGRLWSQCQGQEKDPHNSFYNSEAKSTEAKKARIDTIS